MSHSDPPGGQGQRNGSDDTVSASDVTCVIPSHGRPEYIAETIESVMAQTEAVAEVLVISDVEAPETETIVRGLAVDATPPIRWIDRTDDHAPGVSGSRNRGVIEARTAWVAMLDDDDQWEPTFAAEMCAALNRSDSQFALCAKVRFGDPEVDGVVIPVYPDYSSSEMIRADSFAHGGNIVIAAGLATEFPYDAELLGTEDWDVFIRLRAAGIGYEAVGRPLVRSRIHTSERVSQSGLGIASMCRLLATKHRHTLDVRARRALLFEALWIERDELATRRERYWAYAKMLACAPVERVVIDRAYRHRMVSRLRRRMLGRPAGDS